MSQNSNHVKVVVKNLKSLFAFTQREKLPGQKVHSAQTAAFAEQFHNLITFCA